MLSAAVLFLLGHLVALWATWPPVLLVALLPGFVCVSQAFDRHSFLMLPAGFMLAALQVSMNLSDRLSSALAGQSLAVTGYVASLPQTNSGASRFLFVTNGEQAAGMPRRIQVTWYRPEQALAAGDVWQLRLRLRRPRGGVNPLGFDYERWLFRHGIGATAYVVEQGDNRRIGKKTGIEANVLRLRQDIAAQLLAGASETRLAGLIAGIAVGDRRLIGDREWQTLRETGTAHLMAISGLHVGMTAAIAGLFGALIWLICPPARRRLAMRDAATVTGFAAAAAYALLAGLSLPTRRALIMLAAVATVGWSRRTPAAVSALGAALVLVLIGDPLAPLDPGFWLSFGAVSCLALAFSGRFPAHGRKHRRLRDLLRAQLAVSIGLLPLSIAFFGLFAPAGLLANLLLIPLFGLYFVPLTLALLAAMLSGVETAVSIILAALEWGLRAVLSGLDWLLGQVPAVAVPVPAVPSLLLAIIGSVYLLAPRWPGRLLGLLMFLPLFFPPAQTPGTGDLRLIVMDVGQGLAVVVETRNRVLIYDPGPRYASGGDAAERVVLPYLSGTRHATVDRIVVSHGDSDHAGGLATLRHNFPDADLIAGGGQRRVNGAQPCRAGQRWRWDDVGFRFMHPDSDAWDGNNASCVLLIETRHCRILLTGDIQVEAERRLSGQIGPVDVALVAHHGSRTSSSPRWVAELSPTLALVSAAFDNRWQFPVTAVAERWQQSGAVLVNTATDGALTIDIEEPLARMTLTRERHASRTVWRERFHSPRHPPHPSLASTVSGPAPAAVSCRDSRHH